MKVVQAVPGVFHHFELARELLKRNKLEVVYSSWPWARLKREQLSRRYVKTFPLIHTAEYLLGRTLSAHHLVPLRLLNAVSFDAFIRGTIPPCDVFIALSGTGSRAARHVQERGGLYICDRGSTHHRYQDQVLEEEFRLWGIQHAPAAEHITRIEEEQYEAADLITVPSTAAYKTFVKMGIPASKLRCIPYGVRLDLFRQTRRPETDSFTVVFAGQVSLRKGIPYLLEAFSLLKHPRKRLVIVGPMFKEIEDNLRMWPTEHVSFTGPLSQHEVAEQFGRSHVLVLASVEEGLALVQAQAMACGCPVIATYATGAEDLFSSGIHGFIVPDRDARAIADKLQLLADTPRLQTALSDAAVRRVNEIGGWEQYGNTWNDVLEELVGMR